MSDPDLESLPMSWQWSTLSEIAAIKGGLTKGKKRKETDQLYTVPYLRVANVQRGFLDLREIRYIQATETELSQLKLVSGDVLFTEGGDRDKLGRGWIWSEEIEECIHQNHVFRARLYLQELPPKLISLYSNSFGQRYFLGAGKQTTNLASINLTKLSNLPIPLPPLNEQRRIVAKIEALTAHSRKAREALDAIPALLDQFRQSVLAAAFRGDLTADWRAQNPDVEPAEKLLERIRVERRTRWEKQCQQAKEEGLRKPKSPKTDSEAIELTELPKIPKSWCWERLVNVSDLVGGVTKGRKFKDKKTINVQYLRVANVQDGFLDLKEIKQIEVLPEDLGKYQLKYGDILFTEGGDRDKLGRGTVWRNEVDQCIHQNHVYRARLSETSILPEYISLAAKTEYSKDYFFRNASQTVNLASINLTTLGKLPLPIPSTLEQKEICENVREAFTVIENLRRLYQDNVEELSQLDQSILAKAFRGELVPQDPNDEPASVLLDRIRAEREKAQGKKGKGRRKKG